jgi:hypothetical protein
MGSLSNEGLFGGSRQEKRRRFFEPQLKDQP